MKNLRIVFIFFYAVYYNSSFLVMGVQNNINKTDKVYLPTWEDLDSRPLPQWYESAKIGIFIHWGVYSVPSFKDEWFQFRWGRGETDELNFMDQHYTGLKYEDFAPMFTADHFHPKQWAQLFLKSGAKYVVFTSKHHDGFALFPSSRPNWNSVDVGPKRDIVRILSESITELGLKFGIYYSLLEWFNNLYIDDIRAQEYTTVYTDSIVWPDIKFLVNTYKPSVLWADGDEDVICRCFPSCTYWKSRELLAWLYNESPVKEEIVVNDRWCNGTRGHHGDFYNHADRFNPKTLLLHKWENAFSLDRTSWGYRRDMKNENVIGFTELLETIVSTVSCGGNVLINVGPTKEGIIVPIFEERLLQLGNWLQINGEAIYNTSSWIYQNDNVNPNVWYTCKNEEYLQTGFINDTIWTTQVVYAIFLKWPDDNKLRLMDLTVITSTTDDFTIKLINPIVHDASADKNINEDGHGILEYTIINDDVRWTEVELPSVNNTMDAWVLKIQFKFVRSRINYA